MLWKSYDVRLPETILYGMGALASVGNEVKRLGKKALLVTDSIMEKLGYVDNIKKRIEAEGVSVVVYSGVNTEPTVSHVEEGLKLYLEEKCDVIVALGGGSPIDVAKAIGILATNGGLITDYMGINKVKNPIPPVVAIPTTSGTGSEVTKFTIITDTVKDVKMLIGSILIVPKVAIDDPELTLTMPPKTTAATGIDAFTHAIEAYISRKSHPFTDVFARSAIQRIARYIRRAWSVPDDIEARSQMMLASLEAGVAFSNASVTIVHGMSRPIGAVFHVPHGISNAVLLPVCMEFCMIGSLEKFADVAKLMGEQVDGLPLWKAAEKAVEAIKQLCKDLQIPTITGLGIDREKFIEKIPKMAEDALASGSPGNAPRVVTKEDIMELYKKAL
ncbi:MAG: iron-containing alcohol dehydrogenase [Synergistetes bacterium]|nr:iron-containing alcohol dehydrogenase [Synergistota bacterium]